MPLNRALVGKTYPGSEPYEVSRELIRRFAEAIGDDNPVYRCVEAARAMGHPDVIAPPTFLTVLTLRYLGESPQVDPELGLDISRVVHGEQRFDQHRPVVAGDVLSQTTTVEDICTVGANELMTLVTEVRSRAGDLVATATNTIVSRGTAPH